MKRLRKRLTKESKLYANILADIEGYKGDANLLDALLNVDNPRVGWGNAACVAWYMFRHYPEGTKIKTYFAQIIELAGGEGCLSFNDARYLFSSRDTVPMFVLKDKRWYKPLRSYLEVIDVEREFWDAFLPFGYKVARGLAAHVMTQCGMSIAEISKELEVSERLVSNARKNFKNYKIKMR